MRIRELELQAKAKAEEPKAPPDNRPRTILKAGDARLRSVPKAVTWADPLAKAMDSPELQKMERALANEESDIAPPAVSQLPRTREKPKDPWPRSDSQGPYRLSRDALGWYRERPQMCPW